MIRRPPRSTLSSSSAASDVYKRQPPPWPGEHEASPSAAASPSSCSASSQTTSLPRDLLWTGNAASGVALARDVARSLTATAAGALPAGECGGVGDVLGAQLAVDGVEGQTGDEPDRQDEQQQPPGGRAVEHIRCGRQLGRDKQKTGHG